MGLIPRVGAIDGADEVLVILVLELSELELELSVEDFEDDTESLEEPELLVEDTEELAVVNFDDDTETLEVVELFVVELSVEDFVDEMLELLLCDTAKGERDSVIARCSVFREMGTISHIRSRIKREFSPIPTRTQC